MNKDAAAPQVNIRSQYDRHVMAKHSEVYPSQEELDAVQTIISHVECALKTVSDQMEVPKDEENTEAKRWARPSNILVQSSQLFKYILTSLFLQFPTSKCKR